MTPDFGPDSARSNLSYLQSCGESLLAERSEGLVNFSVDNTEAALDEEITKEILD